MKSFDFVLFFMLIHSSYAIVFNEIMYDPLGSDTDKEWVEIYNNEELAVNLSGWKFMESGTNHNLNVLGNTTVLFPKEYAVIVTNNESFLLSYQNFSAILIKSTFSLSNTGETLVLKNKSDDMQDNVTYSSLIGGSENGMSIGKHLLTWNETRPTPGYENMVPLFCDWKISIISNWSYDDHSSFKIYTENLKGGPAKVTISKRVEDLEGNLIKSYENSTSRISTHNTLTYSPNFPHGAYLIKSEISPDCEDVDSENNFAEKMIFVKSKESAAANTTETEEEKETKSFLVIDSVYDLGKDKKAQFGQIIRAKVIAYRGNTAKYSVSVSVEGEEKVSKDFKFNVKEKYSTIELTIPIQIKSNCKNEFENGDYKIVAEGLGEKDEYEIEIEDDAKDSCVVVKENKTTEKTTSKTESKEGSATKTMEKEEITISTKLPFNYAKPFAVSTVTFESSQRKAEKMVPYLTAGLAISGFLFFLLVKVP